MRPEDKLYRRLSGSWCRGGGVMDRVETHLNNGIPDLLYSNRGISFWVELKDAKPQGDLLRFSQLLWHNEHERELVSCVLVHDRELKEFRVYYPPFSPDLPEIKLGAVYYKVLSRPAHRYADNRSAPSHVLNELMRYAKDKTLILLGHKKESM